MQQFRPMRRFKQQLTNESCVKILENASSGVLALIGDNGYPAMEGHKLDAIRSNPKCSFCVIDQDELHPESFTTHFRSVIAFGQIHIIEQDTERLAALRLLGHRYAPGDDAGLQREIDKDFTRVLLLCLDIEHLTGKQAIELTLISNDKNSPA